MKNNVFKYDHGREDDDVINEYDARNGVDSDKT